MRALSLGGAGAVGGDTGARGEHCGSPRSARPVDRGGGEKSHRLLDEAIAARRRGEATAGAIATDAYMRFEPFEKRVGAVDPGAVVRVEEGFVARAGRLARAGHRGVARAGVRGGPAAPPPRRGGRPSSNTSGGDWARFVQSAGIILREGFEIVLVVGALLAYVRRSGQAALVRAIYVGVVLGVARQRGHGGAPSTVLRLYPGASDVLEGAAMLLAAGVLFWVSYWLVSKAGADRWQRFIQGKVKDAMAAGSSRRSASLPSSRSIARASRRFSSIARCSAGRRPAT